MIAGGATTAVSNYSNQTSMILISLCNAKMVCSFFITKFMALTKQIETGYLICLTWFVVFEFGPHPAGEWFGFAASNSQTQLLLLERSAWMKFQVTTTTMIK